MACVWKCAYLQMAVSCQEEKLDANELLPSLLVIFVLVVVQGVNEDQLCPVINWFC